MSPWYYSIDIIPLKHSRFSTRMFWMWSLKMLYNLHKSGDFVFINTIYWKTITTSGIFNSGYLLYYVIIHQTRSEIASAITNCKSCCTPVNIGSNNHIRSHSRYIRNESLTAILRDIGAIVCSKTVLFYYQPVITLSQIAIPIYC